jgi:hypothetical protein
MGWSSKTNYGGIVGVAKDGHIIYGPWNTATGNQWTCAERDVCNGRTMPDGSYAYVATTEFPYLVGCWGPGPLQTYKSTCTTSSCGTLDPNTVIVAAPTKPVMSGGYASLITCSLALVTAYLF